MVNESGLYCGVVVEYLPVGERATFFAEDERIHFLIYDGSCCIFSDAVWTDTPILKSGLIKMVEEENALIEAGGVKNE